MFQSWFSVGVSRIMLLDAFGMKGDVGRCRQRMAGCFDIFACFCLEGWPYTSCIFLLCFARAVQLVASITVNIDLV